MKPYATTEKNVGETPLEAIERFRRERGIASGVPLAYAGRLDPMASGTLLVLIGDECKRQEKYHGLDKEYTFEILFGIRSDTGDVLGLTDCCDVPPVDTGKLSGVLQGLIGNITLPYPHFSSKTVRGKPLHMWTLENRLDEIEIPTKQSRVYALRLDELRTVSWSELYEYATLKIETIPTVTDARKILGKDFRRVDVRNAWGTLDATFKTSNQIFYVARITCVSSSGTYMRSLAEVIASKLGTCGLAYSIHRNVIGNYFSFGKYGGFWLKKYSST